MVYVPAGEFLMGTNETDSEELALEHGLPRPYYEDEQPLHRVNLPAFLIDLYEVSNKQYKEFIETNDRRDPDDWKSGNYPESKAMFPVVYVNWFDADAYCRWKGKRLPTEAEWEKAARGDEEWLYPWGNQFEPAPAHIARASVMIASATDVGKYPSGKSPYGAYDMIGNVWEWTDSWYRAYHGNPSRNENFGQIHRVTRGLSFMSVGHYPKEDYQEAVSIIARTSFRSYDYPTSRLADLGFRCARTAR